MLCVWIPAFAGMTRRYCTMTQLHHDANWVLLCTRFAESASKNSLIMPHELSYRVGLHSLQ